MPLNNGFKILESNSPLSLSACLLWLDFSDPNTVTLNGSDISQINDKSGNNNHFVQGSAVNQPAYTDTLNGKNVATLTGTEFLTITGDIGLLAPFEIFAMVRINIGLGSNFISDSLTSLDRVRFFQERNSNLFILSAGISQQSISDAEGDYKLYNGLVDATNAYIYINGVPGAPFNAGTNRMSPGIKLGGALDGNIGEYILINRRLISDERNILNTYMANKWGLSI